KTGLAIVIAYANRWEEDKERNRLREAGRGEDQALMRGYFAVGVDGISKPMNLGNLLRISHAFGASFFFSIAAQLSLRDAQSDTSQAEGALPVYAFRTAGDFRL